MDNDAPKRKFPEAGFARILAVKNRERYAPKVKKKKKKKS